MPEGNFQDLIPDKTEEVNNNPILPKKSFFQRAKLNKKNLTIATSFLFLALIGFGAYKTIPGFKADGFLGVTVQTLMPTNITATWITPQGIVSNPSRYGINLRAFEYSTSKTGPYITVYNTVSNIQQGQFSGPDITGLKPETTYYIRAKAMAMARFWFPASNWVEFKTLSIPVVQTLSATRMTHNTVMGNGKIVNTGGEWIPVVGFQFGTSKSSYAPEKYDVGVYEAVPFSKTVGILEPNTTYYIRALARNSVGVGYGEWVLFKTLDPAALTTLTVQTLDPLDRTSTSASPQGYVVANGGYMASQRGFQYGLSTFSFATVSDTGSFGTGPFSKVPGISGLTAGKTYYIRAFAINPKGAAYGGWITFKTLGLTTSIPTVRTIKPTFIQPKSTDFGASIVNTGDLMVSERGFQYGFPGGSYATLPEFGRFDVCDWIMTKKELLPNTTYVFRAYAVNSKGTGYGEWLTFKTLP